MAEFMYNASALAAGGVIRRGNVTTVIPSLASVALAPTGGEGKSVLSNYYSEELSFAHAETRVFGAETSTNSFTTSTYVLIRNLRIFDRLAIERLRAVVTSTRGMEPDEDHAFELSVSYRSVQVDGVEVAPVIDFDVANCRRYADLQALVSRSRHGKELAARFGALDPTTKEVLEQQLRNGRAVQGSVVKSLDQGKKLGQTTGHHLVVPKLGTVRFGELMLKPGRRRLNLLRLQFSRHIEGGERGFDENVEQPRVRQVGRASAMFLEAPGDDGGSMTVASVEGNGSSLIP